MGEERYEGLRSELARLKELLNEFERKIVDAGGRNVSKKDDDEDVDAGEAEGRTEGETPIEDEEVETFEAELGDHTPVEGGGGEELEPEEGEELGRGEDLEADGYVGRAEKEISKAEAAEAEVGPEANPTEVEGYDLAEEGSEQETAEADFADESEMAYHDAAEGMLMMERVIGRDDRRRVYGTRTYPWRTICALQITTKTGRQYICSGNFIGDHTVMTAGHCVYMHRQGGWPRSIRVIPGANGPSPGNWPFGSAIATRFATVRGWIRRRSPDHDYGVVQLRSKTLGRKVGWLGFAALSWWTLIKLRINNSGYPADKGRNPGPRKSQWWNFNRIVWVTARRIFYLIDTFGGQSGSPVWRYIKKKGSRHQVAIHAYGGSWNSGTRITSAVFRNMRRWARS